jgi:small subunit ribosomal protein S6
MAVNVYECMFLLDTNKVAGDVANAESQLMSLVQKHNAEPLASRPWDERRLAYPINKHKKGLYYLMYVRAEGKNLVNLERDIALNEMILRSLIIKIDPKLVDTMLSLVKGEHAPALHGLHDEPGEGGGTPKPEENGAPAGAGAAAGAAGVAGGEGRPARRPRRQEAEEKD